MSTEPYRPLVVNHTGIGYFPAPRHRFVCLECGVERIGRHNQVVCGASQNPHCHLAHQRKLESQGRARRKRARGAA